MLWWQVSRLKSPDVKTRQRAAAMLGDSKDARAVEPLLTALQDQELSVRAAAVLALAQIDTTWVQSEEVRAALASLEAARKDQKGLVREEATAALGCLGVLSNEQLVMALKDQDDYVRAGAAEALGYIGDQQAVLPLLRALEDKESHVRFNAALALGRLGDPRALQALVTALADEGILMEIAVRRVLPMISRRWKKSEGARAAVPSLVVALNHANHYVRAAAARALGDLRDARAIAPLAAVLKDNQDTVQKAARKALKKIDRRWRKSTSANGAIP